MVSDVRFRSGSLARRHGRRPDLSDGLKQSTSQVAAAMAIIDPPPIGPPPRMEANDSEAFRSDRSITRQDVPSDGGAQHFAEIVDSSDDAILTKDLNGVITSWNRAAERLFGYRPAEIMGQPISILIPPPLKDGEATILARLRRGDHVQHYETVRQRRDGTLIHISLSASPLRDARGKIVGSTSIARDISERRRMDEHRGLLIREMDHRLKNLFTLAGSIISLSARQATNVEDLATSAQERLGALARAHALTIPNGPDGTATNAVGLHCLIATIIEPYDHVGDCTRISGPNIDLTGTALASVALILHELATNAAKYGALSAPSGKVDIECISSGAVFTLVWKETGGPRVREPTKEGFGSLLGRITATGHLGGAFERDWQPDGLCVRLSISRAYLER